jgi:hypothetical protein
LLPFEQFCISWVCGVKVLKITLSAMLLAALSVFTLLAMVRRGSPAYPARADGSTRVPVVVELFTSEGCSSCPPADALLTRLAEQQPIENAQLIALEEHVDYWNDLGWTDPFSSREWTARQYAYAGTLGNGNPYTPQMVVDGRIEFVGSNSGRAQHAVLESARTEKIQVSLDQTNPSKEGVGVFSVKVGKSAATTKRDTTEVWFAVTETGLHSAVARGENAGEDLHHAAVVRWIRKIGEARGEGETSFAGEASVPLQAQWKRENLKAVVFVQEKKSLRILGAAEMRFAK